MRSVGGRPRRGRRDRLVRRGDRLIGTRHAARGTTDMLPRQPAVVRVAVVVEDQAEARLRVSARAELAVRPRRPVQERRPVIGAGKRRGRALEHLDRVGVVAASGNSTSRISTPRARRANRWETSRTAPRTSRPHRVLVGQDVVRAEIVERFFRPGICREIGDERARLRDVLVVLAELAQRGEMEEPRFRLARRASRDTGSTPSRAASIALQIEVALGDAQIGELAIVAARQLLDLLERGCAPRRSAARRTASPRGRDPAGSRS